MSTINRFEQLTVRQKARSLTKAVYEATRQGGWSKDFGLSGQIQRASVSIMSNIAEGQARRTTKEYIRFLLIAYGSVSEVRSQLYVGLDIGYLEQSEFERLQANADEVSRLLSGLISSLEKKLAEV